MRQPLAALLISCAACSVEPNLLLTITDPEGLAGSAATLSIRREDSTATVVVLDDVQWPQTVTLVGAATGMVLLSLEVFDEPGELVAVARVQAQFDRTRDSQAVAELLSPCVKESQSGDTCVLENGERGVCSPQRACINPTCGDGVLEPRSGEVCDDGNLDNGDSCLETCQPNTCGDGFVDSSAEECDDSNREDADACTAICRFNVCGDGLINPATEACDDGNLLSDDACLPGCVLNTCGDTFINPLVEECDDGNHNPNDECNGCARVNWQTTAWVGGARLNVPPQVPFAYRDGLTGWDHELTSVSGVVEFGEEYSISLGPVYPAGTVLVAEPDRHRILALTPDGTLSTFAGTGLAGTGSIDGLGLTEAAFTPNSLQEMGDGGLVLFAQESGVYRIEDGVFRQISPAGPFECTLGSAFGEIYYIDSADVWSIDMLGNITNRISQGTYRCGGALSSAGCGWSNGRSGGDNKFRAFTASLTGTTPSGSLEDGRVAKVTGLADGRMIYLDPFGPTAVRSADTGLGCSYETYAAGTAILNDEGCRFSEGAAVSPGVCVGQIRDLFSDDNNAWYVVTEGELHCDGTNCIDRGLRLRRVDPLADELHTLIGQIHPPGDGSLQDSYLFQPAGLAIIDGVGIVAEQSTGALRWVENNRLDTRFGLPQSEDAVGVAAAFAQLLHAPTALAARGDWIAATEEGTHTIRLLTRESGEWQATHVLGGSSAPGYAEGDPSTARFDSPGGVAIDPTGKRLFLSDTGNHVVRTINLETDLVSTLFAGEPGVFGFSDDGRLNARFSEPRGLAFGPDGALYVADTENHRVRRVAVDGQVTTVLGTGQSGFGGTGLATAVQINRPLDVAVDGSGNLYVAATSGVHQVYAAEDGSVNGTNTTRQLPVSTARDCLTAVDILKEVGRFRVIVVDRCNEVVLQIVRSP